MYPIELISFMPNLISLFIIILIGSIIPYFVIKLAVRNALNEHYDYKNKK